MFAIYVDVFPAPLVVCVRIIDSVLHCLKDDFLCNLHGWFRVPETHEADLKLNLQSEAGGVED